MTDEEFAWVRAEFTRCWPWLEAALEASPLPTHRKADVWEGLAAGHLELWPKPNSACLIEIKDYPTGARVLHGLMAGGDLSEVQETVDALEAYAVRRGCHFAAPQGRRGWLRALKGYREAYTVMCKDLRHCPD